MRRLLQCRLDEVKAVYHEKELVDVVLTMSHKLEEHMTGTLLFLYQQSSLGLILQL